MSGLLALSGGVGALLLSGNIYTRTAFLASVVFLLVSYTAFAFHIRRPERYTPLKALVVVTRANTAGILAAVHFGLFSPAPMVLMVPLAYFGTSNSSLAAFVASSVMAVSLLVPSVAVATDLVADPGMMQVTGLSLWGRLLYAGLVQLVLASGFVMARISRRATRLAMEGMEAAVVREEIALARSREAQVMLAEAQGRGARGPLSGDEVGDWVLGVVLGRGAAGDVYEAHHVSDHRRAAVKVLRPDHLEDPLARKLAAREANLLQELENPHLVRILDFSLTPRPYLAMEFLDGEDLGAMLLRRGQLERAEVAHLVDDAAAGLAALHALGVVHRDIKPSNLFALSTTGPSAWKVLDLGVSSGGLEATITSGMVVGSPGYMSPEQVRGERVDPRADQFALAAVAYRAMTGRPPFSAPTVQATLAQTLDHQPPAPSQLVRVPGGVDAVLAVGMAKDPKRRFRDTATFADALNQALEGLRSGGVERQAMRVLDRHPWGC